LSLLDFHTALLAIATISSASAYYDKYGVWHDNIVEHVADTVTGGRYSDAPVDREERRKADRQLEDKQRDARRKYQDKQEKIQRKKEDRRSY